MDPPLSSIPVLGNVCLFFGVEGVEGVLVLAFPFAFGGVDGGSAIFTGGGVDGFGGVAGAVSDSATRSAAFGVG